MRKILPILFAVLLALTLSACGDVSEVKIVDVKSDIYSQSDINAAVRAVKSYFRFTGWGCKLIEIKYIGDGYSARFETLAKDHGAVEGIVLTSTYDDGGTTRTRWEWELVRGKSGRWRIVNYGYC